eukprot:586408_1
MSQPRQQPRQPPQNKAQQRPQQQKGQKPQQQRPAQQHHHHHHHPPQRQQHRPQQQQRTRRSSANCCNSLCEPCNCGGNCDSSILFAGFIAFYILSFLWDIFVIRGGYLALAIAQSSTCVNRTGFSNISPELILCLLFVACFHGISLVWIIGFMHSKAITNRWLGGELIDVPREWPKICGFTCDWAICLPGTLYEALLIAQFGLSVYVYEFLDDLNEVEPGEYVDHFCIGLDEAEEALMWMEISLVFFMCTVVMSCVYGCLIRIGTNDVSILEPGQQRVFRESRDNDPQSDNRPLNANRDQRR